MWHWGFYNLQSKTICLIKQTSFCSTHVCSCIGGTPPVTYNIFGMPGIPSQCLYILGTCQAYRKNKGASCDWCTTPPVLVARPRMLYNPAIYFTTPSIFLQSQQSRRQAVGVYLVEASMEDSLHLITVECDPLDLPPRVLVIIRNRLAGSWIEKKRVWGEKRKRLQIALQRRIRTWCHAKLLN